VSDYWPYIVAGITAGSIFAIVAAGLVLTYRTTGVFNLAFGAQAFVSAVVFYDLVKLSGLPTWFAFLISVFVVAPLIGYALDRIVFRYLTRAPVVTRIGVALGLAVALPAVVKLFTRGEDKFGPPSLGPSPPHFYEVGSLSVDSDQIIAMVATLVAVVLIGLLLRYTALGLQMRAVVESHRLVELAGVNANRANTAAWVLSSVVAGLAGVLLAPLNLGSIQDRQYTVLVVAAIAAAVFARLRSLPLAILGGLLLGLGQSLIVKFLDPGSILAQGIRPAFPFAVMVLLLLFLPGLRDRPELVDPLAGVDPPAPSPGTSASAGRARRTLPIAFAVGIAALAAALALLSDFWLGKSSEAIIMATIFLSFVMLTGLAGHLSLCQAAFAGIGAFTAAQLAAEQGMSVLGGAFIGAAVAAFAGALVAVPSLRLSGLFLALGTLAFGLMVDSVIFPQTWVSGGGGGSMDVPRPLMGSVDFTSNGSFLVLCAIAFTMVALFVWQLRRGSTGAFLSALRGSPTAAAAVGIDERRARIIVFTLAAGIAGFGGALLAAERGEVAPVNFITDLSLYWTVVALAVGVATIRGAVAGGLLIVFVPEILAEFPERWLVLQFILFGLGVLVLARHPEGAFELVISKFRRDRLHV